MLQNCFYPSGDFNQEEFSRLAHQFRQIIYAQASRYYLPGGDIEDLYQWGLLGLYKAVMHYDETSSYSFDFIAKINIKNMIKSAITMANRKKHLAINQAFPLYHGGLLPTAGLPALSESLPADQRSPDPLDVLIAQEAVHTIMTFIETKLSTNEQAILQLYLQGYKQRHISETLNFDIKAVDNAIQRARKKLHRFLDVAAAP